MVQKANKEILRHVNLVSKPQTASNALAIPVSGLDNPVALREHALIKAQEGQMTFGADIKKRNT